MSSYFELGCNGELPIRVQKKIIHVHFKIDHYLKEYKNLLRKVFLCVRNSEAKAVVSPRRSQPALQHLRCPHCARKGLPFWGRESDRLLTIDKREINMESVSREDRCGGSCIAYPSSINHGGSSGHRRQEKDQKQLQNLNTERCV